MVVESIKPSLLTAVAKLAIAGDQAGFSVEQLIQLLNAGISIEAVLDLIALRVYDEARKPGPQSTSSRWIM